mmetsp:Transcript_53718/g.60988  ORF Transcript_53718/g.60988 Transcript_53718/m.60988 type:complete len:211 (-) Transcript_53718:747-1379(-)
MDLYFGNEFDTFGLSTDKIQLDMIQEITIPTKGMIIVLEPIFGLDDMCFLFQKFIHGFHLFHRLTGDTRPQYVIHPTFGWTRHTCQIFRPCFIIGGIPWFQIGNFTIKMIQPFDFFRQGIEDIPQRLFDLIRTFINLTEILRRIAFRILLLIVFFIRHAVGFEKTTGMGCQGNGLHATFGINFLHPCLNFALDILKMIQPFKEFFFFFQE